MSDGSLSIDAVAAPAPAASPVTSSPATAGATLTLRAPEAVTAVAPAQAEDAVQIDPTEAAKLDAMVQSYVAGVTELDVHDAAFRSRVRDIEKMGEADIKSS